MSLSQFEHPRLQIVKAAELPISSLLLLELMQAVLDKGVPFRFCARGWSMQPFIHNGDVITVEPLSGKVPGIGEVVAFIRPEQHKLVVHRIIGKNDSSLIIQGDNSQDIPAETIQGVNVLGRVVCIERRGHKVWLGFGPERFIIAWLSRQKVLTPLGSWLSSFKNRLC